jgi:hypothetical protein
LKLELHEAIDYQLMMSMNKDLLNANARLHASVHQSAHSQAQLSHQIHHLTHDLQLSNSKKITLQEQLHHINEMVILISHAHAFISLLNPLLPDISI